MGFFSLITIAFSSVFYGAIITAVVMAILYVVLKSVSKGMVRTPVFFITGVILAILLVVHFSLIVGAIQAKDAVDAAEIYLSQLLEGMSSIVGAQDSQQIMDAVTDKFPLIGVFVNMADFSGHDVADLPDAMHRAMTEYLTSYIWHRVWWSLGFIVVACLIVMLFDRKALTTGKPRQKAAVRQRKNYDDF